MKINMKIKWKKKTYTLLIIPDANQSVARVRLSNMLIVGSCAALVAVVITSLVLYALHLRSIAVTQQLRTELSGDSHQYAMTLSDKEQTIDQLQNEIIKLSEQTKDMKSRFDEMAKLESDLKSISQHGAGASGAGSGSTSSGAGAGTAAAGGDAETAQGGAFVPVTETQIELLSSTTSETLSQLGKQLAELQTNMTETKQNVLEQQHLLRITPSIYPTMTRTVTSPFGYRKDPINGLPSFHSGIDFGAAYGSDVFATADGTVVAVGSDSAHGNNIIISHGQGLKTWYMHMSKTLVSEGDTVVKGQRIGLVGSTGRSTGAHLHYELLKNGQSSDPTPYLQAMRKAPAE